MPVWKGGVVLMELPMLGDGGQLAAKLTLLALAPSVWNTHIRLMLDNTTAAAYIDKMGGLHSPACNDIALAIWAWARQT